MKERQLKDEIKRKYCRDNNILEIEITYLDNLEEQLDRLLKIII